MAILSSINLPVEISPNTTGLAQAVLSELIEKLQDLANSGQQHVIDLTSLPMNSSDKRELENLLGQGEVNITLSTIGDSNIIETAYSGIWWIKHFTADGKLVSELIEITAVPEIIRSHPDDIKLAAKNIKHIIDNGRQEHSYE